MHKAEQWRGREVDAEFINNRVSIVTTVLNGESYLSRMLDSILEQTYKDLEMILVDGGSTDQTVKLAESYQEKFQREEIEYHVVRGHGNNSAGMNQGFPFVKGEFLIWPDGDDVLERESIAKRVEFLRTHSQYQCVRSLGYYVREGTEERAEPDEVRGNLENENLFFPILYGETYVCCGCYMFRSKEFFDIYPERKIPESGVGQNLQMLLPFTYRNPCPTIREELYRVYVRPDSMSHTLPLLSVRQKEKRQADLELLVDTLAELCQITDQEEIRKIQIWKARQRYRLNQSIGKKRRAAAALLQWYQYGGLSLWEFGKNGIRIFCEGTISRIKRWIRR